MEIRSSSDITLVIGGARSGKSSYAEALATSIDGKRVYMATAEPFDDEMRLRIARHQKAREGLFSRTVEEPLDLASALAKVGTEANVVLIDCMTVWVGNLLHHFGLLDSYAHIDTFLAALENPRTRIIIVTNEVGQGIVPGDPMSRHFRDHAGWLNQSLAKIADTVVWMVAGIPVTIKGEVGR
jgi:adenosylcobinamide kinase/adenosylcobinamide-phosphate guanylyltransferase